MRGTWPRVAVSAVNFSHYNYRNKREVHSSVKPWHSSERLHRNSTGHGLDEYALAPIASSACLKRAV